ncbi:MAG: NfeD family protein [Anaerolineales bacterium]
MSIPPTLAYLVLMGSIFFSLLAILSPGTGVIEASALLGWFFTAYAVYQLGLAGWALLLILLSVVPFVYSLRLAGARRHLLLGMALLGMVAGSLFLFPNPQGTLWPPAVDAWIAIPVSLGFVLVSWVAVQKIRQAMVQRPVHDLDALIGQIGEARTRIHHEGTVYLRSELWSARSQKPIPAGRAVRVIAREGFVLLVEEVEPSSQST